MRSNARVERRREATDHDPLFRFHRWLANLRVLEIEQIKPVPYVPTSHPFIERLIGTIRREYLDRVFFWNGVDLTRNRAGVSSPARAVLDQYAWQQHCRGLFQTPIAA